MDYFLTVVALLLVLFIALVVVFLTVLYLIFKTENEEEEEKEQWLFEAHCFECEIEMPVKEKKGRLYCSQCGLRH
jgi:hypothetical protein